MALKSGQSEQSVDIEELLDHVDKTLDRVKVLYEQYFLGMQKQPPTHIHNDVERRLRDLTQIQIRNTGLRYRFATLQQKFGSYNTYWRRTLRQIENGTYIRQLSKISRQAALSGEEIPEEILAAMPKRMRDQVKRDREQALAIARRREAGADGAPKDDEFLAEEAPAVVAAQAKTREPAKGAHVLAEDDFDIDSFFAQFESSDAHAGPKPATTSAPGKGPTVPMARPATRTPPSDTTGPTVPIPRPGMTTPAAGTGPTVPIARPVMPTPPPATGRPAMPTPAPGAGPTVPMARPTMPMARPTMPTPPPTTAGRSTMPTPPPPPGPRPAAPAAAKRPDAGAPLRPPPGMNDADVNALYAKYVKAKEMVGETAGPGAYSKLMRTINSQAPKIMEQYKAKGVEFSVVVKDNQVVIKAKPKV